MVDDDPDVRDIVERCLKDSGYQVWTCEDGSRVFDIVNEKGIDLAIVDLVLPDTDGLMLTPGPDLYPALIEGLAVALEDCLG